MHLAPSRKCSTNLAVSTRLCSNKCAAAQYPCAEQRGRGLALGALQAAQCELRGEPSTSNGTGRRDALMPSRKGQSLASKQAQTRCKQHSEVTDCAAAVPWAGAPPLPLLLSPFPPPALCFCLYPYLLAQR
eukprot:1143403-Pelagomonas_calceolata.AAC.3